MPAPCRAQNAFNDGYTRAMRGENGNYSNGAICEEGAAEEFRTNFDQGYEKGKTSYCDLSSVENRGFVRGSEGSKNGYIEREQAICEDAANVRLAFERGYKRGLEGFCADVQVKEAGLQAASSGQGGSFPADKYLACGTERAKQLRTVFANGYQDGIVNLCSESSLQHIAHERVQAGDEGLMPEHLHVCMAQFPKTTERYQAAFQVARTAFIDANCTFEKGVDTGKVDASAGGTQNTKMPSYCDTQHFNLYLTGYLRGWDFEKSAACNRKAADAYQKGIRDGEGGWSSSYSAPMDCSGEHRLAMDQSYRNGYQLGRQNRERRENGQPTFGQGTAPVGPAISQSYRVATNETRTCDTVSGQKSGTIDTTRCRIATAHIACYQEVTETCRVGSNGESSTRTYREFTGECVRSFSDCW